MYSSGVYRVILTLPISMSMTRFSSSGVMRSSQSEGSAPGAPPESAPRFPWRIGAAAPRAGRPAPDAGAPDAAGVLPDDGLNGRAARAAL